MRDVKEFTDIWTILLGQAMTIQMAPERRGGGGGGGGAGRPQSSLYVTFFFY